MKKYIASAIGGWIACELYSAARAGYFTRAAELVRAARQGEDFVYSFSQYYNYIVYGLDPRQDNTEAELWPQISTEEWFNRIRKARAMNDEGFSIEQIAEAVEMPEDAVNYMLEPGEELYFRIMLRDHQYDVVRMALEALEPEDDDAYEIIQETLHAILGAEKIEIKDI